MTTSQALDIINKGFTHSVKDPLWGNVPFTSSLKAILDTKTVEKLSRIKQTGPSYHIYPGAVHTRLNHSIGVYHLGRKLIESIARKSEELPLTETGIYSFLAACLLHDIGHFPYAHSLKELALREHEEIAASLITHDAELNAAIAAAGADPVMTAAIIDKDTLTADDETLIYRSVLSGALDPDKLDYLSRDAFFAGIPYGRQDTDFILSSISLQGGRLAIDKAAVSSLEQVLFSKYMMYKNLYWHKGVRSATAMIKKALLTALRDKVITYDDLYLKDDYEFLAMAESKPDYGPFRLIRDAEHGRLLERKAYAPYAELNARKALKLEDRYKLENRMHRILKRELAELQNYEVIIDIPEPINFETHIQVLEENGEVHPIREEEIIFSQAGELFSRSLRTVSLFAPAAVSDKRAERAFKLLYE